VDPDPIPPESALIFLSWIWINLGNADPDPAAWKWTKISEQVNCEQAFCSVSKEKNLQAERFGTKHDTFLSFFFGPHFDNYRYIKAHIYTDLVSKKNKNNK
jgi:hypothetical protein